MLQQQVGEITIHRILESERPDFDAAGFFPQITPEQWAPYRQRLAGWAMDPGVNGLVFPMQSFLLRTRHHTIVVDTCVGDHKERARPNWNMTSSGEYLKRFAETGVRPEQVDFVMTTHFHTDRETRHYDNVHLGKIFIDLKPQRALAGDELVLSFLHASADGAHPSCELRMVFEPIDEEHRVPVDAAHLLSCDTEESAG